MWEWKPLEGDEERNEKQRGRFWEEGLGIRVEEIEVEINFALPSLGVMGSILRV